MLYCLIAFILGWLLSKYMGDGFSVGGGVEPNNCLNGKCSHGPFCSDLSDCDKSSKFCICTDEQKTQCNPKGSGRCPPINCSNNNDCKIDKGQSSSKGQPPKGQPSPSQKEPQQCNPYVKTPEEQYCKVGNIRCSNLIKKNKCVPPGASAPGPLLEAGEKFSYCICPTEKEWKIKKDEEEAKEKAAKEAAEEKKKEELRDYLTWKCSYAGDYGYNIDRMLTAADEGKWGNCCRTKDGKESPTCKVHKNKNACISGGRCEWGTGPGTGLTGCDCSEGQMDNFKDYIKRLGYI